MELTKQQATRIHQIIAESDTEAVWQYVETRFLNETEDVQFEFATNLMSDALTKLHILNEMLELGGDDFSGRSLAHSLEKLLARYEPYEKLEPYSNHQEMPFRTACETPKHHHYSGPD